MPLFSTKLVLRWSTSACEFFAFSLRIVQLAPRVPLLCPSAALVGEWLRRGNGLS